MPHTNRQWEAINRKQITRWQHVSQLKASSFYPLVKKSLLLKMQQLILGYCHLVVDRASLSYTHNHYMTIVWYFNTFVIYLHINLYITKYVNVWIGQWVAQNLANRTWFYSTKPQYFLCAFKLMKLQWEITEFQLCFRYDQ